jgi:HemK-related putative methylase
MQNTPAVTYLKQIVVTWLIKKVQKYGPHKVRVLGRNYEVSKDVFNPKYYYTSEFMAKHIQVSPGDVVLDMGTGSGIQAVTAGQTASKVVAADINPEAVKFAARNIRNNGLESVISVVEGDLFAPFSPQREFSVILFTPPYLAGTPKTCFDKALYDKDKALLRRFLKEAKGYLKPEGYVQVLYSSIAELEEAVSITERAGWKYSIIARKKTFTEEFIIFRLTANE